MVAVVLWYVLAGQWRLAAAAAFGVVFGLLIQRGQICFTAAFRDMWVSGRSTLSKALALGMAVGTVGTFVVILTGRQALIHPVSPGTAIGGLLFGIGIVLASGCETGMMYRAMEGQVQYWLVFAGNIVGATVLAYGWESWGLYATLTKGWSGVNLIETWGAASALVATLALLGAWYVAAGWWQKRYRYGRGLEIPDEDRIGRHRVRPSGTAQSGR